MAMRFSEALAIMEDGGVIRAVVNKKKVAVSDSGSIEYAKKETRSVTHILRLEDGCLWYRGVGEERNKWGVVNGWPNDIVNCGDFKVYEPKVETWKEVETKT